MKNHKIGFGGGCHWCTEAVFQSLKGVDSVEQGWIASEAPFDTFSEAVIVHFNTDITLETLIEVHLLTHNSTSRHSMRDKYRSAIYYFDEADKTVTLQKIYSMESENNIKYVTQVIPFKSFKENVESQLNYYLKHKDAPFCQNYISPKLTALRQEFGNQIKEDF